MARFKLVFEDKVVFDGKKPSVSEVVVPVVAFKDLQEQVRRSNQNIPIEYIGTPAGKVPVYFMVISKTDEESYHKQYNDDIHLWVAEKSGKNMTYEKAKKAGLTLVYLDQPIGFDEDGEEKYLDIDDPTQNPESHASVNNMLEQLIAAISTNDNYKTILNMKLNGFDESEIVKNLDCSIPTAYKEVERFKLLAAALWGVNYEGKKNKSK